MHDHLHRGHAQHACTHGSRHTRRRKARRKARAVCAARLCTPQGLLLRQGGHCSRSSTSPPFKPCSFSTHLLQPLSPQCHCSRVAGHPWRNSRGSIANCMSTFRCLCRQRQVPASETGLGEVLWRRTLLCQECQVLHEPNQCLQKGCSGMLQ